MKKLFFTLAISGCAFAANAQNIYGGMENWRTYTAGGIALEAPQAWYGSDSLINFLSGLGFNPGATGQKQLYKSTTFHGGSFAARMVTANFGGSLIDTNAGGMVNGLPALNIQTQALSYSGLTPVTQRVGSLSVWVMYTPAAGSLDSGVINLQAIKSGAGAGGKDSVLANSTLRLEAISAYTQKTVTLNYGANTLTPDKVLIAFGSSALVNLGTNASSYHTTPGSELIVDDASLMYSNGIAQPLFGQPAVKCFPNPTQGLINFETSSTAPLTWQAFAIDGRIVGTQTFTGQGAATMTGVANGMYFYRVTANDGTLVQTGRFVLEQR